MSKGLFKYYVGIFVYCKQISNHFNHYLKCLQNFFKRTKLIMESSKFKTMLNFIHCPNKWEGGSLKPKGLLCFLTRELFGCLALSLSRSKLVGFCSGTVKLFGNPPLLYKVHITSWETS